MKVVLTEKPSVAMDIAKVLNAGQKKDGFLIGNGWVVTWAFGHLVELKEPNEYSPEWKRWSLKNLPIIPKQFALRAKRDQSAKRQLEIIRKLFTEADEIICATDAGREGELIFRYIQTWSDCNHKPFKRLWINSLTKESIKKGFSNLQEGYAFDALYNAAKCRSEADWIVGINSTRFHTVHYGKLNQLWSIGRVQTPILAMIVKRDLEIKKFISEDYREIHTLYREVTFKHKKGKLKKIEEAQSILEKIRGKNFKITDLRKKEEKINPPLLYDLTDLQKDMNKRYGLTAKQTLSTAQSLYEKKHITYPRTDSRYLNNDIKPTLRPLLEKLNGLKSEEINALDLNNLRLSKRIIDDKKVTDHHAIIPTNVLAGRLLPDESKVYNAIVIRFISVFYLPCLKDITMVFAECNNELFKTTGTIIKDPGWQALYPSLDKSKKESRKDEKNAEQTLPDFSIGETGPHCPALKTIKTTPPRPFTEASLLNMMETAGRTVEDEAMKEALKDKGIGTPATRASIIEVLIKRKYILRQKKNLFSTSDGCLLISLIKNEHIKSAEMTGEWESKLKQIEGNKFQPKRFMDEIIQFTTCIVSSAPIKQIDLTHIGNCPLCKSEIIEGKKGFGCSAWKMGCKFVLWKKTFDVKIDKKTAREIIQHKKTKNFYPLKTEDRLITAYILLKDDGQIGFDEVEIKNNNKASEEVIGQCPVCKGDITENTKSFGCSNWRQGCKFVIWKTVAKKKITQTMAKKILCKGETGILKGFKSKTGKEFIANLKLINFEVKFDFSN